MECVRKITVVSVSSQMRSASCCIELTGHLIEYAEWLIHEQRRRLEGKSPGDGHPLLHPSEKPGKDLSRDCRPRRPVSYLAGGPGTIVPDGHGSGATTAPAGFNAWEATEMGRGFSRHDQENCSHSETITISTSGLDRNVCEICGHVSMTLTSDLEGDIDRNVFARQAE